MRDVKKVLEMRSQNYSQRQISVSLKISRDTIRKIFNIPIVAETQLLQLLKIFRKVDVQL